MNAAGAITDDISYNFFVSDIRNLQNFSSAQPMKTNFRFDAPEPVPAGVVAYALIITNKLKSISSDGQKHFHLI